MKVIYAFMSIMFFMIAYVAYHMPDNDKEIKKIDVNTRIDVYKGERISFDKLHKNSDDIRYAGPGENTAKRIGDDYDDLVCKMQYMQSQIDSLKDR